MLALSLPGKAKTDPGRKISIKFERIRAFSVDRLALFVVFTGRKLAGSETGMTDSDATRDIFDIFIQGLISSMNLDKFFLWHEYLAYAYRTDLSLDLVICIFILFHFSFSCILIY